MSLSVFSKQKRPTLNYTLLIPHYTLLNRTFTRDFRYSHVTEERSAHESPLER